MFRPHDPIGLLAERLQPADNGCIIWTGTKTPANYGMIYTLPGHGGRKRVHRFVWELANGPIPNGLTVEHRCHTEDLSCPGGETCMHRLCCNLDHLELLTAEENSRRGRNWKRAWTHCSRGHEFTPENTRIRSRRRACRTCDNARNRLWDEQHRSGAA